jgi:hypothetical protein
LFISNAENRGKPVPKPPPDVRKAIAEEIVDCLIAHDVAYGDVIKILEYVQQYAANCVLTKS